MTPLTLARSSRVLFKRENVLKSGRTLVGGCGRRASVGSLWRELGKLDHLARRFLPHCGRRMAAEATRFFFERGPLDQFRGESRLGRSLGQYRKVRGAKARSVGVGAFFVTQRPQSLFLAVRISVGLCVDRQRLGSTWGSPDDVVAVVAPVMRAEPASPIADMARTLSPESSDNSASTAASAVIKQAPTSANPASVGVLPCFRFFQGLSSITEGPAAVRYVPTRFSPAHVCDVDQLGNCDQKLASRLSSKTIAEKDAQECPQARDCDEIEARFL